MTLSFCPPESAYHRKKRATLQLHHGKERLEPEVVLVVSVTWTLTMLPVR